jgi:nucleotide-binding universal stress UspA family protein
MRVQDGAKETSISNGAVARSVYERPMMKVLLAIDGSARAELAARAAIEQADARGWELHVLHVGRLPNFLMQDPGVVGHDCKLYDDIERESQERLRKLVWRVKVAGGTVAAAYLRMGRPGREIVRLGEEIGAGVIVVGSRGRGRLRRTLTGSTSGSVVRHALCPVLVVRRDTPSGSLAARERAAG